MLKDRSLPERSLKKIEGGFSFSSLQNFSEEIKNINVSIPKYIEKDMSIVKSSDNNFLLQEKNEVIVENAKGLIL